MFVTRRLRKGGSREKGQTLILVAVVFVALLGMGAMAVDVGQVLWSRGAEQNIADAAALAGVHDLPLYPDKAVTLATQYAQSNYPSTEPITVTAVVSSEKVGSSGPFANNAITVEVHRTVQPGLRAAVGGGPIDVPAVAQARVMGVDSVCGAWPWGIDAATYKTLFNPISGVDATGQVTTMNVVPGNKYSPGNFGGLALLAKGGSEYYSAITNKACVDNPSSVPTEPGAMANTVNVVNDLIDTVNPGSPIPWSTSCATPFTTDRSCTFVDGYGKKGAWVPDNVYYTGTNATNPPYGIGCPSGNTCGESGPPTALAPRPFPSAACGRVGMIPVIDSWPGGRDYVAISGWVGFYLIGSNPDGKGGKGHLSLTGVFLGPVAAPHGGANDTDPNNAAQVYYYLYK